MKKTAKIHEEREEKEGKSRGVWDCGSPLYDSYELVSLSSIIERHIMKVPSLGRSKRVTAGAATNQSSQPWPVVISASSRSRSTGNGNKPSNSSSMAGQKKKEKAKTYKHKLYAIFSKIGLLKKEANPNEMI